MVIESHQAGGRTHGVAAGHHDSARSGMRVLEQGGNAVDAVIAMVFSGAVTEGTLTSLSGGGFMVVHVPDQQPELLDFYVAQPGRAPTAEWETYQVVTEHAVLQFGTGPRSVAVPGTPRGLAVASRRWGRLPLATVAAPAADLAQNGVTLTAYQAREHGSFFELFRRSPEGRIDYAPVGEPRQPGELFRQPQLASDIEEIAATDGETMYTGRLAEQIMRWSAERGGPFAPDDLRSYEPLFRKCVRESFETAVVYTNPPPSMGGSLIVQLLDLVRRKLPGEGVQLCLADALVELLQVVRPPVTKLPEVPQDPQEAATEPLEPTESDWSRSPNTTHVSAIDADGMVACATTTLGYGAGDFIPGSGIQLNNILAEYDSAARRPVGSRIPSMMAPTLFLGRDGRQVAIGAAGSDRIPQALTQCISMIAVGSHIGEAVAAPRFVFDGKTLHAEPGFDELVLEELAERYDLTRWPHTDPYFGTTSGVALEDDVVAAAGDPRREGSGIVG